VGLWFDYTFRREADSPHGKALASWRATNPGDDRWLWDLIHSGEATRTGNGYPMLVRVQAKHALPALSISPVPDRIQIYEPLQLWDPEEWLEIEGWDQS
jgi:hypothetical protein